MSLPRVFVLCLCVFSTACTGQLGEGARRGQTRGDASVGAGDAGGGDQGGVFVASQSVARRLTRKELDNTLRDLVGETTAPARQLLPEDPFGPYDNEYTQQVASGALIDALAVLAQEVAARVLADVALRAAIVPCTPTGAGDADCFRKVVVDLAGRTFRRPLRDDEVTRYMALQAFATEDNPAVDNDFYTAVDLLIRALLQDPEFLYRIETGGDDGEVVELDGYQVATRMSYLLWGTTPDAQLLQDAAAATLLTGSVRREIAARMLDHPRARTQLQRFHAMWLGYRAIPHSQELAAAFQRETNALLDRVIFDEDASYLDVFTYGETYLDDFLAAHYGLDAPDGGEGWVGYGDSGRAGLLSHGSLLSSFGKFSDTSPTQRGILIRTRLMCTEIPPPPANVNADEPPGDMDQLCKYERYEQHRSSGSCAGCHSQMDPIGFGLENYDLAGRFRETDDGLPQCIIEGKGSLPPYGDFSGPAQLGQILVDEGEIEACVVRQLFTFAVGRKSHSNEEQAIDTLLAGFQQGDYSMRDLLLDYISADAFALRLEPVVEEETP